MRSSNIQLLSFKPLALAGIKDIWQLPADVEVEPFPATPVKGETSGKSSDARQAALTRPFSD
jgi:hypothetical protein